MADDVATTPALDVHIVTPEREIWAGDASFVLARSASGDLGVLSGHEPTLAILGAGPLEVRKADGSAQTWGVEGGFLSIGKHGDRTRVDVLAELVTENADDVQTRSGGIAPENIAPEGSNPARE